MKKIAALVAATFCLLAFAPTALGAARWGWNDIAEESWRDAWASLEPNGVLAIARHPANASPKPVTIIPVRIDPVAARAPGALASVLPVVDDALKSLREAVAGDRQLAGALAAHGLDPDQVVGASRLADGSVAVLVGKTT
jgi:hypothetical protein